MYSANCIRMTKMVLAIRFWFKLDYYFTIMSYGGLVSLLCLTVA